MSNFDLIDEKGEINQSVLQRELLSALDADVKYKQTDAMKKRAVKVSKDYDEFKNMVAAAHLKKVTAKEVESLGHVKRGWQQDGLSEVTKQERNKQSAKILLEEKTKNSYLENKIALENSAMTDIEQIRRKAKKDKNTLVTADIEKCMQSLKSPKEKYV